MAEITWVLIAIVAIALIFDYTNGFHDAANAIATSIGTRALRPGTALAMAAVLNVAGGLLYETKVASTMTQIVDPGLSAQPIAQILVLAALIGAIVWNLITWWFGIPSSSSHALIGGIVGATITREWSLREVEWGTVWSKVIVPTVASPLVGFVAAVAVTTILYRLVHGGTSLLEKTWVRAGALLLFSAFIGFILDLVIGEPVRHFADVSFSPLWFGIPGAAAAVAVMRSVIGKGPGDVGNRFRVLQTLSAGYMALEHGHNDAQKTMGIITLALIAANQVSPQDGVPLWVKLSCSIVIGLGTFSGGKRIIRTMGMKLVKLSPLDGFAAEAVAGSVILAAGSQGMPISTTHAITASITGVGATRRLSAVRWGVTGSILTAWVLTLPAAAAISALAFQLLRLFVGE